MRTHLYDYDLPDDLELGSTVAIDTETMGLNPHRDRLCLVQLGLDDGTACLVRFPTPDYSKSENLKSVLARDDILKIFHFARFDVAVLQHNFAIRLNNVYCTKIASHLVRTFTNKHGLKDLCKDLLKIEISKGEQTGDWGAPRLTDKQIDYAVNDVLHLRALKEKLDELLEREKRAHLAKAAFAYLPYRAELDLSFGQHQDVMAHKLGGE